MSVVARYVNVKLFGKILDCSTVSEGLTGYVVRDRNLEGLREDILD